MDLYEALKSGTTEEELMRLFNKDLNEAKTKLEADRKQEEEAAAAHAKYLEDCRYGLAWAILNYTQAYFNEEEDTEEEEEASVEAIVKTLKDFEKEMDSFSPFIKVFDELVNKSDSGTEARPKSYKIKFSSSSDDDIIRDFINSLK